MGRIAFLGGGNMAEALIKGIIKAGVCKAGDIYVSDICRERLSYLADEYGVVTTAENKDVAAKADILVLSVKPQNMDEVLESIRGSVKGDSLIVSIAAGVKAAKITAALGDVAVVRVMPNTPALIGEGVSGLFANEKGKAGLGKAEAIFSAVGEVVVVDSEDLMDAVTAVSGSGPAYFFYMMESLMKAGKSLGLTESVAKKLVLQTAKGAALLAVEAEGGGQGVAELREKVTSPGGTTEAALKKMGEDNKFDITMSEATRSAFDRSRELSG